jgi:hypothetical protein
MKPRLTDFTSTTRVDLKGAAIAAVEGVSKETIVAVFRSWAERFK